MEVFQENFSKIILKEENLNISGMYSIFLWQDVTGLDYLGFASMIQILLRGPYPKPSNALRALRLFHCQALASKLASTSNKKAGTTKLCRPREPDWIRTNGLLLRRQLLYPTELPVQNLCCRNRAKIMFFA
jgi:hypothetical protein